METRPQIPLETLVRALAQSSRIVGSNDIAVRGIAIDSRAVRPGDLFIALRGEGVDGHDFIAQAIERGAAAIVAEVLPETSAHATTLLVLDSTRAASQLADAFYGMPSRAVHVAGVTGTNGKTTTTQMIAAILNAGGIPCGSLGTIGADLGARHWAVENTTPLAPQLHGLIAQMRDAGAAALAMEVSSHALALQRVADVRFHTGALTNVTRDHLDFHGTFEAYAAAKRKLFDLAQRCVFNADDAHGARWAAEMQGRKTVTTYALAHPADTAACNLEAGAGGSTFDLDGTHFEVLLPGRFNAANALCAISVARGYGVSDAAAAEGLARLDRVPGRMEHLRGKDIDVVVDYAHTPDALENVLRSLREVAKRRVICVFGCGGDRDRGKRAQMGAVSARYADYTIVTSDNPRSEDPLAIVNDVLPGVGKAPHETNVDRRAAIGAAVRQARAGDVVLIAGKGHENYQIVGSDVLPFDDAVVAREALAAREAVHR
jgi:UDP-N-acetylmuramoyl-L-alanyl-D-glutamate--2,6-diaminopimelate ligase